MSKGVEILNLSYLEDKEREHIINVFKKDDNLRKIEDKRVRRLKNELLEIKKKGGRLSKLGHKAPRMCVRCQKSLGIVFNRGDICKSCELRVCKACRVVMKENEWICTVCAKSVEIRRATGDWFYEAQNRRFKTSGREVVRKSIMRKTVAPAKKEKENKTPNIKKESTPLPPIPEGGEKRTSILQFLKPEDARSIRSNHDTQSLKSNQSGTPNKKSGKPEDSRSLHSNSDAKSVRSLRSLLHLNGPDKKPGKQTRFGEDAVSIHSNLDAQSLRSVASIPRSIRSDTQGVTENSQGGEATSQASLKMDSSPQSKHSSPASARGSVHSAGSMVSAHSGGENDGSRISTTVAVHQSSPTPSKRSIASNYSHTRAAGGMKACSSIPEGLENNYRRRTSATPSITLSRVSGASDRSRSELDLSGYHLADGNEDTASIRSKSVSVPGGLNRNSDLEDIGEDLPDALSLKRGSKMSSYSMASLNSVYSETGDYGNVKVSGRITLNISYSYKTGALNVLVKSCTGLAIADEKRNRTDPYVKAYLLPDKSRLSKRKTKIKTNTTNPEFNETLKYLISHTQLETRTLYLSVWHNDRFGRNSFLGEVNIPLDSSNIENQELQLNLQPKLDMASDVTLQYKGEITIGLRYIPPEKNLTLPLEPISTGKKSFRRTKKVQMPTGAILEVHVKEAKNLTAVKSGGTSDTFVKGYLLPENKSTKHKTPIIKKSVNPQWNFTFSFTSLEPEDLDNVCLELTVWDKESLSSNVFLGGVCLSSGTGISYGKEVDWMDAHGEEQDLWQKMLANPGTLVEGTLMLRSTMAKGKKTSQKS